MYFALNQNIDSFDTYLSFLTDIIQTDNQSYKEIFQNILTEAQQLNKTNNFFAVQSERFGIISFIAKNSEFLESIDPLHLQIEDYKNLYSYLESNIAIES